VCAAEPASAPGAAAGARVVAEAVRRVHPGPIVAVDGASLTLEPGEFVALSGPSGSGKTSLLSIIGALDHPTSGQVAVDGNVLDGDDLARFHREVVGFVFQDHHLLTHLSVRANVEMPLIGAGLGRRERYERAIALLEEVGLRERAEALAGHLSAGERQRVAVARALANEPRLLLADEPTGALDTDSARQVLDLIEQVRARRGTTLLVVTHDPLIAERADRILSMRDGRIAPGERPRLRPSQELDS
jgi:ABC-type lipoprotein export system ATPase subunit